MDAGYRVGARNTSDCNWGPRYVTLRGCVGSGADHLPRFIDLETDYGVVPDPELVCYETFRGVLLAISDVFEVDTVLALPFCLTDFWPWEVEDDRACLDMAWISYVGPRFAHLVTPPPTAIVEHRPDGGLLMAATSDTFDVDNPAHMSVARDIVAGAAALRVTSKGR